MTFTGKPGDLGAAEILGIIHASDSTRILQIKSDDGILCLQSENGRLLAAGSDRTEATIRQFAAARSYSLPASGSPLEHLLRSPSDERLQGIGYHAAETCFFDFLACRTGSFEWVQEAPMGLVRFDEAFARWVVNCLPDTEYMNRFRERFPDFDQFFSFRASEDDAFTLHDLTLQDIRLISEQKTDLSVRSCFRTAQSDLKTVSDSLSRMSEYSLIELKSPESSPVLSLNPFLQMLLANLVDRLMEIDNLIGRNGELISTLRAINEKLDKLEPGTPPIAFSSDELGDLVDLTGSLEGLLDLNGVEELNLKQEIPSGPHKTPPPPPPKPKSREEISADKKTVKAGVKRQPMKTEPLEDGDNEFAFDIDKSKREMKPDKKREEEASRIVQESAKFERESHSMEEKVEAKVRYRRFSSNVTMAYNRYVMTNQNLFEMFGIAPNADKKAVHKAFVKAIETINPRGIRFRSLDQPSIEKAIYLRDVYKRAYIILMDDDKKRRYIGGMRKGRESVEENKTKAMRLFNTGMERVRHGKFDEARQIFAEAAKLDPNSPVYYSVLEDIDKEEREGNAVKFFQAGILAFKQKNDYERAIQLIRKAISLRSMDPIYHLKLAEIQMLSGKYKDDAVVTYQHALELDPGNQDLRLTIANLVKNLGRKQEAANMYQDMLKWNPDNTVVKKFLFELQKEGIKPVQDETSKTKEKKETEVNEEFE